MSTCKDCIHYKICEGFYEDEGTPLMASLCKEGDICNQFETSKVFLVFKTYMNEERFVEAFRTYESAKKYKDEYFERNKYPFDLGLKIIDLKELE